MTERTGVIIGIDLGTTTTEAAVYRNGKVEMIPDFDGNIAVPSAVGIDDRGNFVVGEKAKAQYVLAPERTAIEIKRKWVPVRKSVWERRSIRRWSFPPGSLTMSEGIQRHGSGDGEPCGDLGSGLF